MEKGCDMPGKVLTINKLADKRGGEGSRGVDPATGSLAPWPLAGVEIVGEAPTETTVSTAYVVKAKAEGWLELVNERVEHRPGGPPEDPWRVAHTFVQADEVVLHCVSGDVRYRVTRQPDKYVADDGTASVEWYYTLELVS